jgi:hypothetical protein
MGEIFMEGIAIKDILRFKKELYFNGAVQVDWFYQLAKQQEIAKSFVFHGPKYFGVSEDDITFKSHKLVDTATFAKIIADRLNGDTVGANFFMTIAPYGTGKSHLAVTLASLFSRGIEEAKPIIDNIASVDREIANDVYSKLGKPNIVLVLNGMRDFNLNYEILNATQKILTLHNIDSDFLKSLTKSYDIAKNFVVNTYDTFEQMYKQNAYELLEVKPLNLKQYLLDNILQDANVFEVINKVYHHVNGTFIRWDEGISAGDVLLKISQTLCGERGQFNKVLVLFDEFGRYIEFASSYPTRAGDSALQQIYEAVQDSDDKIIFVGFIQSDLKTYLTRVERTSNINRYVGRYEASEKIHLSSNLETIFANLIERTNNQEFERLIAEKFNKESENEKWKKLHQSILEWLPSTKLSSVWNNYEKFKKVILEGIYPLHPITTWMLSNLSSWLQQRSALTFLNNQLELFGDKKLHEFGDLPFVTATTIVQSDFFQELLVAEQDGRQQSEYCILYNQILTKYGDKFDERQKKALAANLILRIGRFKTKSKEDAKLAIQYVSGMTAYEVDEAISSLENDFGVISFDDIANVFDFVADATGINDFKRLLRAKRDKIGLHLSHMFETTISQLLSLSNVDTAFSKQNMISTNEWQFTQHLVHIEDVDEEYLRGLKAEWDLATQPNKAKGKIIWMYVPSDFEGARIQSLQKLIAKHEFEKMPILFFMLDDKENNFYNAIIDYQISLLFTEEENIKYARFIPEFKQKSEDLVRDRFNMLARSRLQLTKDGIIKISDRISKYADTVLSQLYDRTIPFPFTGFMNKSLLKPKQALSKIARIILSGISYQLVQSETTDIKNRIEEVLFENREGSWGVLNANYQLIFPTNRRVRTIFDIIDEKLNESKSILINELFEIFQKPPYGINDYALSLLIAVYLVQRRFEIRVQTENGRLRLEEWGTEVFLDKEVDIKKLTETVVEIVDPDQAAVRYISVCEKIVQNTDVDKCPSLKAELERLKREEDIPDGLQDRVARAEMVLEEGCVLYENTKHRLARLRVNYDEAQKEKDFKKLFEIIEESEQISGAIENSSRYVYNSNHVEVAKTLIQQSRDFIEKEFEEWLLKLKCQHIGQLTGFEKWVKSIISYMVKYGYTKEASKLKTKLEKIIDDLNTIQKLQNINGVISEYLTTNIPTNSSSYEELLRMREKGKELIDFVLSHKVDRDYLKDYLDELEPRVEQIQKFIEEIENEIIIVTDSFFEVTSLNDCENILKRAKLLLNKGLRSKDHEPIEETANQLQNFLNDIRELKEHERDREYITKELEILVNKWGVVESDINFPAIIESYRKDVFKRLDELEQKWIERYIHIENIDQWDSAQCVDYLESTKNLPAFLVHETKRSYGEVQKLVYDRLNELSVEGVLSLFNSLTEEQKKICYEKITQLMNHYTQNP